MEKQIKNVYDLSCNWYDYNDGKDIIYGCWTGKVVSYEDNTCVGYAIDNGKTEPTHMLKGMILDGKALSLWKININDCEDYPILFHTFANAMADSRGFKDSCYGKMFSKSVIQFLERGLASIKTSKKGKSEIEKITTIYDEMAKKAYSENDFNPNAFRLLGMVDSLDPAETSKYISEGYQLAYQDELPFELLNELYTQPNNE